MSKKFKRARKLDLLPSFLLDLTAVPEDVRSSTKRTTSAEYLGPVFFGNCEGNQPPLHSMNLDTFHHVEKTYFVKDNIKDLFLPKAEVEKPVESKTLVLKRIRKRTHDDDQYTHRCPGTRKAFVQEVKTPVIDLGESTSVIEGETVLEIPLYRLKKDCSGAPPEFELVNFSDIKEKKRDSMPYKERIAHVHFPKQFANVTVIGPTIPASITVTKLPSKRKTQSVEDLLNEPTVKKTKKKKTDEVIEESEISLSVEEGAEGEEYSDNEEKAELQVIEEEVKEEEVEEEEVKEEDVEREKQKDVEGEKQEDLEEKPEDIVGEKQDDDDLQEFVSERNAEEINEAAKEVTDEETADLDDEQPAEEIKAEEMEGAQINEETEENEEQGGENPEEEAEN